MFRVKGIEIRIWGQDGVGFGFRVKDLGRGGRVKGSRF